MSAAVEVTIEAIAAGGDGVARSEGMVIFVPRTAPGDVASVRFVSKGRYARGQVAALLSPSPQRAAPPCPHYTLDRCGGCQLQHLRYDAQLAAKRVIVRDALRRIARRDAELPPIRPSEAEWRYRRKLTLALRRTTGGWIAGLHAYDDPDRVFSLDDCPITDERVVSVWKDVLRAASLLPSARQLRGSVRLVDDGASFVLEGGERWTSATALFDAVPALSALWWRPAGAARRLLRERSGRADVSASFAQVNLGVSRDLRAFVVDAVLEAVAPNEGLPRAAARVIDAYAGTGETSVALAQRGVSVTAIELDAAAARRCARRLPAGSTAVAARVEEVLAGLLPAEALVLNPPRAGLDPLVTEAVERASPRARAVVYVSCNPATLARDLTRLPGYRVAAVTCFDMFPQTAHVETVCRLEPAQS